MSALLQTPLPTDRPAPGSFPAEPELFEQTVPRTLVHRAAVSEVLLTGIRPDGEHAYRVGAQWPRGHSYYGPVAGSWHDPMLLAETIRQAGLLVAHQVLRVPGDTRFATRDTSFQVTEDGVRLADRPADLVLDVRLSEVSRRGTAVSGFAYDVTCYRDGRRIGTGSTTAACIPDRVYRRLRGARAGNVVERPLPEPVAAERVGRCAEQDVVLGVTEVDQVWTLRADPDHPVLFDHRVDHFPGMVVMEAARQAALTALGCPDGLFVGCAGSFRRYIEFDSPCLLSVAEPQNCLGGRSVVPVTFHQGGAEVASCDVAVRDPH
ncbi:ScbA/BarX family gamma-butyrolactone biosynthesis protein [Streptomyces sp. JJ36]|uniref:ScbA/BarX family gamma-butyrolactone biosynthesis protein n=1 Tax=Streptomyces sp. JJ36 TaxID=2736645 RepID=UPI001F373583|nr:ScbA/BarX family gamma-butyrolactone biosynthesis protein [Streptomyces sp. JJ36]MCF6524515.1 gamma-butyrolactone biosynthesis protein [Streptomyces sp. JJ36]